jgi:hypothetical protein
MKRSLVNYNFIVLLLMFLLNSCGSSNLGFNSVKKTNELQPGMSYDEVVAVMGKPKSSEMLDDKWIVRWNLQEPWKGMVPYDMVFDAKTKTLISWSENEKAYQEHQAKLKVLADAVNESTASSTGGGNASVNVPNDVSLQQQFAVKLYRFSAVGGGQTGGTETTINLCPDGSFTKSGETGYSGNGWGTDSQSGEHGRWRIQGNMQQGKITIIQNGSAREYSYSRAGNDYVIINGDKYAVAGAPACY